MSNYHHGPCSDCGWPVDTREKRTQKLGGEHDGETRTRWPLAGTCYAWEATGFLLCTPCDVARCTRDEQRFKEGKTVPDWTPGPKHDGKAVLVGTDP